MSEVERGLPTALHDLPATVAEALAERDDADFVITARRRITFAEANDRSRELAAALLRRGVGKGTRVGLLFPNGVDWAVTWLAAARIGALTVPLSTFAPGRELGRALRHTDVQVLLTSSTFAGDDLCARLEEGLPALADSSQSLELESAPFLRAIHVLGPTSPRWATQFPSGGNEALVAAAEAEVRPSDLLVVVSTSGATAAPKAVVHTHGSLVRHAAILAQRRGLNRDDRIYSPMPFFWVGGLTMVLLAALTSGAGAVVQERFEPGQALELAEREHVTQISCWPNAAAAMAAHPDFATRDLSAVRGGTLIEALPVEQRPSTPDLMPMPLGMTETGGPHTSPDDYYAPLTESLRGTFGRALPGVEHSIAAADQDESTGRNRGELLLRGPLVMDSLYKVERHDAFTPDGWYPTGDLASFDSAGYLHFAGRATTVIKTAGSNVAPAEVESVLRELDGVTDAYVVGVQDEVRGQDVAAVIATEAGSTLDAEAVKRHAREQLSSFKVPRRVVFVSRDELPMLPTGKADLAALRSIFEAD